MAGSTVGLSGSFSIANVLSQNILCEQYSTYYMIRDRIEMLRGIWYVNMIQFFCRVHKYSIFSHEIVVYLFVCYQPYHHTHCIIRIHEVSLLRSTFIHSPWCSRLTYLKCFWTLHMHSIRIICPLLQCVRPPRLNTHQVVRCLFVCIEPTQNIIHNVKSLPSIINCSFTKCLLIHYVVVSGCTLIFNHLSKIVSLTTTYDIFFADWVLIPVRDTQQQHAYTLKLCCQLPPSP